jgi:hypothetical protein
MSQSHATGHGPKPGGRSSNTCQVCGVAAHRLLLPALLPPLTVVLMMLTAGALLLTAAVLVAPPLPAASALVRPATVVPKTDATSTILAQVAQVALPRTPAVVDLARLIYAPGAGGSHQGLLGASLLVVDAGALTVRLDGAAQLLQAEQAQPVAAGDLVLQPGDGLLLPRATAATFRNDRPVPAVALAAGVFPSGVVGRKFGRVGLARWDEVWSPGATVQPLAGGWLGASSATTATLIVQRLTLPADTSLPLTASGPVDLAVEVGALTLEVSSGLVWRQPPAGANQSIAPASDATLLPDDAVLLQEAAKVTLRNDGRGPLMVLALSVEPDRDDPAARATSSSRTRDERVASARVTVDPLDPFVGTGSVSSGSGIISADLQLPIRLGRNCRRTPADSAHEAALPLCRDARARRVDEMGTPVPQTTASIVGDTVWDRTRNQERALVLALVTRAQTAPGPRRRVKTRGIGLNYGEGSEVPTWGREVRQPALTPCSPPRFR